MRRLVAWVAGTAGGLAAYGLVRRRRGAAPVPAPEPAERDPAEELRAKLAETKEPAGGAAPAEAEPAEDPEERRRRVHEHGRAALDEMRGGAEGGEKP